LRQYHVEWPTLDAMWLVGATRTIMLLLIVVALGWLLGTGVRRLAGRPSTGEVSG